MLTKLLRASWNIELACSNQVITKLLRRGLQIGFAGACKQQSIGREAQNWGTNSTDESQRVIRER